MKQTNVINKFEVVISGVVYEFDSLTEAEKKIRTSYKTETDRNLFRKEIKNGKVQNVFLLE